MPKVRFLRTNTRTGEQEVVGEVRLEGGKVVASTPEVGRIAARPLEVAACPSQWTSTLALTRPLLLPLTLLCSTPLTSSPLPGGERQGEGRG